MTPMKPLINPTFPSHVAGNAALPFPMAAILQGVLKNFGLHSLGGQLPGATTTGAPTLSTPGPIGSILGGGLGSLLPTGRYPQNSGSGWGNPSFSPSNPLGGMTQGGALPTIKPLGPVGSI